MAMKKKGILILVLFMMCFSLIGFSGYGQDKRDDVYVIKKGDTLWDIAKKYPGVSESEIAAWNNLGSGNRIHPGQQLKIRKKS